MITEQQMKRLFVEANPVPDPDTVPFDESDTAAHLATFESRSNDVTDIAVKPVGEETKPKRVWIAAAVVVVVLGVVAILLTQSAEDPPVATTDNSLFNTTWDHLLDDQHARFQGILDSTYGEGFEAVDEIAIRLEFGPQTWLEAREGYVFDGEFVAELPHRGLRSFSIENDLLTLRTAGPGSETYQWDIDGDQLALTLVEHCASLPAEYSCLRRDPIQDADLATFRKLAEASGFEGNVGEFELTYTRVSQTEPDS